MGGRVIRRSGSQAARRTAGASDTGSDSEVRESATTGPSAPPALRPSDWDQPVLLTTAAKGDGIPDLVAALDSHFDHLTRSGELDRRRRKRLSDRTREVVDRATRKWVWDETRAEQLIAERLDEVVEGRLSPYELAADVLDGLKQGTRT